MNLQHSDLLWIAEEDVLKLLNGRLCKPNPPAASRLQHHRRSIAWIPFTRRCALGAAKMALTIPRFNSLGLRYAADHLVFIGQDCGLFCFSLRGVLC